MDKNNTSNSSVCTKIRQAIHKISSYHQDPKPINFASNSQSPSPSPSPIPHQHVDNNSTFIPIEQENLSSTIVSAQQEGKVAKVLPPFAAKNSETAKITTTTTKVVSKGENQQPQHVSNMQGKSSTKVIGQHGHHHHQGINKSLDINETFNEYIQRAKKKIRTVSNIGRGQSNHVFATDHESHGGATNKKEDHREKFSDFIQKTKNKLRTTTIARRK